MHEVNATVPIPAAGAARPTADAGTRTQNVGDLERALSVAGGLALAVLGLRRRTLGGLAGAAVGGAMLYRGASGFCSLYRALGISTAAQGRDEALAQRGRHIAVTTRIQRPPEEVFRVWRDLTNLPRIMRHLESVEPQPDGTSRWTVADPLGVSWTARITAERPGELIAWESLPGSQVQQAGEVRFRPGPGGGTELRVRLTYTPPVGALGASIASVLGDEPGRQIKEDLGRFKQAMEAGTFSSPAGTAR